MRPIKVLVTGAGSGVGQSIIKALKISNSKILIRSINKGEIKQRKGINISGLNINLPTLQSIDIKFAKMAINLDLDWIALSFVRFRDDRELLDKLFKRIKHFIPLIDD